MTPARRDHAATALGVAVALFGCALLWFAKTNVWVALGVVFVGGVLVQGGSLNALARIWRKP